MNPLGDSVFVTKLRMHRHQNISWFQKIDRACSCCNLPNFFRVFYSASSFWLFTAVKIKNLHRYWFF